MDVENAKFLNFTWVDGAMFDQFADTVGRENIRVLHLIGKALGNEYLVKGRIVVSQRGIENWDKHCEEVEKEEAQVAQPNGDSS